MTTASSSARAYGLRIAVVLVLSAAVPTYAAPAAAQPPPVDALAPGYPIQVLDPYGDEVSSCTAGYMVRDRAGTPLMLTAGHCDADGLLQIHYRGTGGPEPLGSFTINAYDPSVTDYQPALPDIGLVGLSATAVPVAPALLNRTPIVGTDRPRDGERLCKIGSYSGISCGAVTKVTSSKVHFEAVNRSGDSGGPIYRDNGDGTLTAIAVNIATPDSHADCQIDHTGSQDCVGTSIGELVVPWMTKWGLTLQ